MPMPLVKIGYLFVRTVSKPVSSALKIQAKNHPAFRQSCIKLAQMYHRVEVRLRRRLAARTGEIISDANVRPLDEEKAVELGANFIGEALIFGIAGFILLYDATRSSKAEALRRKIIEEKFNQLFQNTLELNERQLDLQTRIENVVSMCANKRAETVDF